MSFSGLPAFFSPDFPDSSLSITKQNNVGVVLVEVKGLDADVVLNLRDELLEVDGVGHG